MKLIILPLLSIISISPLINKNYTAGSPAVELNDNKPSGLLLQPDPKQGIGKMRSIVFKSQEYCRAELKDFDFDVHFSIVSATVYFTGTNFTGVEKGFIVSSSLKPIRNLMDRCQPGSIVVFDDVKVKGPANEIRTIDGVTYQLY
jgi:hypothetical protein